MMIKRLQAYFSTIKNIFELQDIEQRVKLFKTINQQELIDFPDQIKIVNPSYLQEYTSKSINQFVFEKNIGSNIRIVHALAHIEYNAFMSYVDTYFRFSKQTAQFRLKFQQDMKRIALEEGNHFLMLKNRLNQLGYQYGSLPVIPKLTNAIRQTNSNIFHRIAVISLLHEGRGVKAVTKLLGQLRAMKDSQSQRIVKIIQADEINHYKNGWKWFLKMCEIQNISPQIELEQINQLFKAEIKFDQQNGI